MRKADHKATCHRFALQVHDLAVFHEDTAARLPPLASNAQWHNALTETVFHRVYVLFEIFISDVLIDFINKDSRVFLGHFSQTIGQSIESKYGVKHRTRITYHSEKHLSIREIEALADKEGRNIPFSEARGIIQRAHLWLAPQFAAKFDSIPTDRLLVVDAAKAIRNSIAHGSISAHAEANSALRALPSSGACAHLRRTNNDVKTLGPYLRVMRNGKNRLNIYIDELSEFAAALI